MEVSDELYQARLVKLERLRARGIDPYPPRWRRTHTSAEARALFEAAEAGRTSAPTQVRVAGRLVGLRVMGRLTFAHIQDGAGRLQLAFRQDILGPGRYEVLKDLDLGDFVGAAGPLFRTKTGEITVEVHDFAVLAKALRPLPEKWHGLVDVEKRYRQRYLDLIANERSRWILKTRSRIVAAIREFLDGRGFIELETPVLQTSATGAAARPFVTYYEALDQDVYLRISLELYLKRLVIGGFDKVYEIGRVFRNEGLSTKHNPEFTMLESYEAYADYQDVMRLVEELVTYVAGKVLGTLKITFAGHEIDLTPPWRRITLREAIKEFTGIDFEEYPDAESLADQAARLGLRVDPARGRGKIIDRLLQEFVEPRLIQPTFVLDYPVEMSPLAKRKLENPRLVERFEGFVGGMEVANAYTELNDPVDQRERFLEQRRRLLAGDEEAEQVDEDFLVALEYGMPPTGGLGMGIDRLVMLFTDNQSIREVIPFPHLRPLPPE